VVTPDLARGDQRRIARTWQAGSHDRDKHEQDQVFGQIHGRGTNMIMSPGRRASRRQAISGRLPARLNALVLTRLTS
jgi:hypothetical protein